MQHADFDAWLSAYGRAWETGDPEAAVALFTDDATYQETPFDEPLAGREAILGYWSPVPRSQEGVEFRHEVLAWEGDIGIAWWYAAFTRVATGARAELDGIFVCEFGDDGRCTRFREWWHEREGSA